MNLSARISRLVPVLAVAAVSMAALAAATVASLRQQEPAVAQRPAADAVVDVVRVPVSDRGQRPSACQACVMGHQRGML